MTRRSKASVVPITDAEISAAARAALDERPRILPDVRVHVEHGYVTLTGRVQWPAEGDEAVRVVRALPGVAGVINNLVVVTS